MIANVLPQTTHKKQALYILIIAVTSMWAIKEQREIPEIKKNVDLKLAGSVIPTSRRY